MNREKFPKPAEICIKYDEALERNLAKTQTLEHYTAFRDPQVVEAIRLLQKKVNLRDIMYVWPAAEVFTILDRDPKEYFAEDILENIVRHIWKESIPEVIIKRSDNTTYKRDRILIYGYEVEFDGWGLETDWLYFDFAVFSDEYFRTFAFGGKFKTSIDVLHATDEELATWLYTRDWDFEKRTLEELNLEDLKKNGENY